MLRKLRLNKKGQNTAEYAILISLVVAGIIAMQTYAQRALQARVRDASQFMTDATSDANLGAGALGTTAQYEPYYLETDYKVNRSDSESFIENSEKLGYVEDSTRTREATGFQKSDYSQNQWLDPQETGEFQP